MRLIDADALIDEAIERYCKDCNKRKGVKNGKWKIVYNIGDAPCRACDTDDMIDDLENAPTIDAVPVKHGHWEKSQDGIRCSECGHSPINRIVFRGEKIWEIDADKELRYCPKCGAQMYDEEGEGRTGGAGTEKGMPETLRREV